eukprot:TRINITY_DN17066_c0_g1_i1.p1 TRINITY_DN17066_c0_g1~~TRINITY_DN17066_c0_g1_i1.p1  ORF type:complete len:576 (+),score=65.08 TRINITY_DN17066_c0_g1_i1:89-1729(+)
MGGATSRSDRSSSVGDDLGSDASSAYSDAERVLEARITRYIEETVAEHGLQPITPEDMLSKLEAMTGHNLQSKMGLIIRQLNTLQSDQFIERRLQQEIASLVRHSKFVKLSKRDCFKKLEAMATVDLSKYKSFIEHSLEEESTRYIFEEGKPCGEYLLGETLGQGHYGVVKKAVHASTGLKVAIKSISMDHLATEYNKQQLEREIAIMKTLLHENVLQLIEVIETPQFVHLVLELVDGGELFESAPQRMFPEAQARGYFQQLILGVFYCHKQGVAHRDLKPANLLLTTKGILKVSDFGLSAFQKVTDSGNVNDSMKLMTCCGSPKYIAPEVVADRGYNGFIADIWSCGVILYLMLCGRAPFEHRTVNGLLKKVMEGHYTIPDSVSPGARDLISRMLVVAPERRATIPQIVAHPWFQVGFDQSKAEAIHSLPGKYYATHAMQTPAAVSPSPGSGPKEYHGHRPGSGNTSGAGITLAAAPGTPPAASSPSANQGDYQPDRFRALPDGVRALQPRHSSAGKTNGGAATPALQHLHDLVDVRTSSGRSAF